MDRSKEEMQTEEKLIKPILTPLITTNILASTDDDTSTESSDTFETWTLVSDKQKENKTNKIDDGENRIELLKREDNEDEENEEEKKVQEQELQDSLNDVTNDDFSDGISIISESESVGRISPHPYLRDHLQDLNMKFALNDNIDDVVINRLRQHPIVLQQDPMEQQLRQRRRSSTTPPPPDNKDDQALQKASQTLSLASGFPPFVRRGLQGIFYVGVGLAILALIGKIVNPTWQPLASVNPSASTVKLEQKVNDMELQNNLMRAEIDLLNKQVKYLNTLNTPQQKAKYNKDYKEGKTFKAWSGNGDSLKPVDITKDDLKRAYKCPDGSYVEIANMCMEQRLAHEPSIVDQFGQVVEDLKQQSEAFKTFEKVAEELQGFQDNPFEQLQTILSDEAPATAPTQKQKKEFIKNKPIYQTSEDFKQQLPRPNNADNQQQFTSYKQHVDDKAKRKYEDSSKPSKDYKKQFGKNGNSENKEFKKPYENKISQEKFAKFRDNSKERNQWNDENKYKDNSKFRDNSKERKGRKFDDSKESKENNSKERFNTHQKRKFDQDDEDSGEWQEKYMKHRENQRKQNEQKYLDNKNWYIKRGDSREYKRSGEKNLR